MNNYDIYRGVIHILDSSLGIPVLSEDLVRFSTDSTKYCQQIVSNLEKSAIDTIEILNDSSPINVYVDSFLDNDDFILMSQQIAKFTYDKLIEKNNTFLWDMAIFEYQEYSSKKLGVVFLEYSKSMTHILRETLGTKIIDLVVYEANLPSVKSKIKNGFIFDFSRKKWRFSEENEFIEEQLFGLQKSVAAVKIYEDVVKIVKKIASESESDEVVEQLINSINMDIKRQGEESGLINICKEIEKHLDPIVYNDVKSELELKEVDLKEIKYDEKIKKKIERKKKITTTDGIEISIPLELYNDSKKVQLSMGTDGRVTIQLIGLNLK